MDNTSGFYGVENQKNHQIFFQINLNKLSLICFRHKITHTRSFPVFDTPMSIDAAIIVYIYTHTYTCV